LNAFCGIINFYVNLIADQTKSILFMFLSSHQKKTPAPDLMGGREAIDVAFYFSHHKHFIAPKQTDMSARVGKVAIFIYVNLAKPEPFEILQYSKGEKYDDRKKKILRETVEKKDDKEKPIKFIATTSFRCIHDLYTAIETYLKPLGLNIEKSLLCLDGNLGDLGLGEVTQCCMDVVARFNPLRKVFFSNESDCLDRAEMLYPEGAWVSGNQLSECILGLFGRPAKAAVKPPALGAAESPALAAAEPLAKACILRTHLTHQPLPHN
jgi:hypothetical protein